MKSTFKKFWIAVEAVLYIACHAGEDPVRSQDICEYQGVKLRYLEQLLQALVHHQILKSVRGPKGGYLLTRDRRKIMLSDIYVALQQPSEQEKGALSALRTVVIQPLCDHADQVMFHHFSQISIQDLCIKTKDYVNDIQHSPANFMI